MGIRIVNWFSEGGINICGFDIDKGLLNIRNVLCAVSGFVWAQDLGSELEFWSPGWVGTASVSRLLRRLVFRVRYLVIGGGHVVGRDGEAVDSEEGDRHEWRAKRRGR